MHLEDRAQTSMQRGKKEGKTNQLARLLKIETLVFAIEPFARGEYGIAKPPDWESQRELKEIS